MKDEDEDEDEDQDQDQDEVEDESAPHRLGNPVGGRPDTMNANGRPVTVSSTTTNLPHLRIEMLSQPRYLAGVRATVFAVAERLGFDRKVAGQIALAVDEALCNIIRYGYEKNMHGRIWISVWPIESGDVRGIRILLEDEGKKIDPKLIQPRPLDDIRPGGLGVHIIREIMDKAEYAQRAGNGMQLLLEKYMDNRSTSSANTPSGDDHTLRAKDQ